MGNAIVLFGATGDLSRRKILPALSTLIERGKLPPDIAVIGAATRELSLEEFFDYVKAPEKIRSNIEYISGNFLEESTFHAIGKRLGGREKVIFYLATPPSYYKPIITALAKHTIATQKGEGGFNRIIIEKPFGVDLPTARELNETILRYFDENQIYRIDHYLGKESVQNISAFRFSNGMFEPIWNRNYIDYITITVAENIGVENRGKYFEEAGILRDIVQNHLFQILALIAMEPPAAFTADAVRDEKVKVFKSVKRVDIKEVVRGQYRGYREEENVARDSTVETFVFAKLFVENWRWAGVPFYIRTGKRLEQKLTEVVITFRQPPLRMFNAIPDEVCGIPNQLVLRIQPERSISIRFGVKRPGQGMEMMSVDMRFNYTDYITGKPISDYERLLLDCYQGDLTLFARSDGVEECWKIIDPIEHAWRGDASDMVVYEPGTWGPDSDILFENQCHAF
ncbi:MAG: glucose-6-phosphate dehydrogenase [Spirochaetales bacterium]|nr:glucose-6-phosphate dehydrogenase [Spirochaetales bacterium]